MSPTQLSMLFSPDHQCRCFLLLTQRLFEIAHGHNLKAMYQLRGAIRPAFGDPANVGLDILEVVQVTATGMEASELKRHFDQHLVFYRA
jgi:hypothetical protein